MTIRNWIITAVLVAALVALAASTYTVRESEQVIITQFGNPSAIR